MVIPNWWEVKESQYQDSRVNLYGYPILGCQILCACVGHSVPNKFSTPIPIDKE
jgi:hypothetical protein